MDLMDGSITGSITEFKRNSLEIESCDTNLNQIHKQTC